MGYGQNIKVARKVAGLTQEQLAKKCGMATITIRQYESEKREPRLTQLECIAKALGVTYFHLADNEMIPNLVSQSMRASRLRVKIGAAFDLLNEDGQQKALERVEELTEIPRYRAETAPQSTPTPQEGEDTTPATDSPEPPPGETMFDIGRSEGMSFEEAQEFAEAWEHDEDNDSYK